MSFAQFRNLVLDQPLEESDLPPRIAMAAFEETRVKNDKKVGFLETRFYVSADLIAALNRLGIEKDLDPIVNRLT